MYFIYTFLLVFWVALAVFVIYEYTTGFLYEDFKRSIIKSTISSSVVGIWVSVLLVLIQAVFY